MTGKRRTGLLVGILAPLGIALAGTIWATHATGSHRTGLVHPDKLYPRSPRLDLSGYSAVIERMPLWRSDASLREIARYWDRAGYRGAEQVDAQLADPGRPIAGDLRLLMLKSHFLLYEGEAEASYATLVGMRSKVEADEKYARNLLATVIFSQGVAALRRGENDNCILCRGESSCIFPISAGAVHTNPTGSRLAIGHFMEYLELFPDDVGVHGCSIWPT